MESQAPQVGGTPGGHRTSLLATELSCWEHLHQRRLGAILESPEKDALKRESRKHSNHMPTSVHWQKPLGGLGWDREAEPGKGAVIAQHSLLECGREEAACVPRTGRSETPSHPEDTFSSTFSGASLTAL